MKSSVYAKKGFGMRKCVLIVLSAIAFGVSASPTYAAQPTYYSCAAAGPTYTAAAYGYTKEQANAFKQEAEAAGAITIKCTKI